MDKPDASNVQLGAKFIRELIWQKDQMDVFHTIDYLFFSFYNRYQTRLGNRRGEYFKGI